MEAADSDYVFYRGFGAKSPSSLPPFAPGHALYKFKKEGGMCGNSPDADVTNAQPPIYTAPTDPNVYAFKRGEHREKINVHAGDLGKCIGELYGGVIAREKRDTIAAWLNTGKDCGETLVENGLVDRDFGGSDAANDNDGRMKSFINTYMADTAANGCGDECDSDDDAGSNIYAQACSSYLVA